MQVVGRYEKQEIREIMPKLLGIAALASQDGGCDFLGQLAGELELLDGHNGQFFTPYDVSRMMAEMTLDTVGEIIAKQGFVTVQEPACGAGGMIIAAADVLERQGFDISQQLYVDATDISQMCWKMSYLQASLRGIPATIRRGNSLSLEMFESAVTPAFWPSISPTRKRSTHGRMERPRIEQKSRRGEPIPVRAIALPPRRPDQAAGRPSGRQLSLFD